MNSSKAATSATDAQINLLANSKVNAVEQMQVLEQ